ncbi:hypothetical protein L2E82_24629 [Cichorium intybus]|uniref:Uncharacterized protein n=1 Tax=Cichorium intybus TaxID=13427 RepID=A0ACB9E181_CICIN|nr:hypothetical protein L2E82_24629 [Cichorium intybus]
MESLQREIILIEKVCEIYHKISKLDSLKPSEDVDSLFTELVRTCIPPSSINIATLPADVQEIRSKLIRLCGEAEGHLEAHFSAILGSFPNPLQHLNEFPYYSNYLKISRLEFDILTEHYSASGQAPKRLAFVGSGPMPLSSIVLASYHLKDTIFHNYDIDSMANSMASHLVSSDPDLSQRMVFHTANIMDVTDELKEYDVIFFAALVGMDIDEKVKVIAIWQNAQQLQGFEVLSVFHPNDDVINSVVISRKIAEPVTIDDGYNHHHHEWRIDSIMPLSCKYCEFKTFNDPLGQMKMIDN